MCLFSLRNSDTEYLKQPLFSESALLHKVVLKLTFNFEIMATGHIYIVKHKTTGTHVFLFNCRELLFCYLIAKD